MDRQTKIDSIVSLMEDFPAAFNYLNLAGNRAFADWFMPRLEALREFDFWEDDELRVIQARRLGNLLSYLKKTSPFWKERLLAYGINPRSASILEDIKRLPVIDRKFFTGKEAYALPRDESHSMIHTRYTSGTTDTSMAVLISDPEMSLDILSCLFRQPYFDLQKMRELLGRKFFFFLGRTVLPHYASFARGFPLDNFTKLSDPNVRGEIYGILKKEPQTLWAFSTVAAEFAHYLAQDGESLPLLAAYTHSESSPIDERLFVREKLNVPVVHLYVACETAIIGDECTSHFGKGYYHIPRERALIEVLDGDNLPVKNNEEGKLVVTILDRKITPILRYANGDRGRILSVSCDCGKKSPLFEMLGREGDRILLPDGEKFSALLLANNFLEIANPKRIMAYQIRQESPGNVSIYVVPANGLFGNNEIAVMESALSAAMGGGIKINIRHTDDIARGATGKLRFFMPLKLIGK